MSRAEQTKAQRRRRNTEALTGARQRLAVDESKLDRKNYVYRFASDTGSRIHDLTVNDDWEVVQDRAGEIKNDGNGVGSQVSAQVGGASGAMTGVLLRKRRDYYNDDKAAEQRRIDEQEAAIKGGAAPGGNNENGYIPNGGQAMTMTRD